MECVDDKIKWLQENKQINRVSEVLKNRESKRNLADLHRNYVITPIDKATGNVAFICKRFYALVLIKELGLCPNMSNDTYKGVIGKTTEQIVTNHKKDLNGQFKLELDSDNQCLPHIYWLPKMHKNPIKFRFIIAAPKCSVKPLSKSITSIFKLFYKQIEAYNKKCFFYSGIKMFWVIQNNEPVIKSINRINSRSKANCISTFDFSTLYTKIPHDKLLFVLNDLIDFCFQGGTNNHVAVTKFGAKWVTNPSKYTLTFDKTKMKNAVKYLMDNCYFTFGEKLFQQIIGIPMGSDPAPFMANLFLYYYESKWLKEIKKSDLHRARQFGNTFRFIDDLNAMNDGGEFERSFKEIYPIELELKKEHGGSSATFLDLQIQISNRQFISSLFDKRDDFPFSIVRMPFRTSNIPSKIFYSSIGAEVLRIARTTSNNVDFLHSTSSLITRILKQGAVIQRVTKTLQKCYGKHNILQQFGATAKALLRVLLMSVVLWWCGETEDDRSYGLKKIGDVCRVKQRMELFKRQRNLK